MIDYKQKINSIYNKLIEDSISKNELKRLKLRLMETICEYCQKYNIEDLAVTRGSYLYVLVDSVEKALKYYKKENGEFFTYTLIIIRKDIKQAKNDDDGYIIKLPRSKEKIVKQIKDFAINNRIDIRKMNDAELNIISEEFGLDVDKIRELLNFCLTAKEIEAIDIIKEEDDENEQNPKIKQTDKTPEQEAEGNEQKQQQQQEQQYYFSIMNDVYMSLSPTKKNTYKVVLINFFIDSMLDDNTDIEKIKTTLEQFKFYDETDSRINQVVDCFIKTGKSKTQEELAKIINLDKTYISKIQKHFKEVFLKRVSFEKQS